MRGRLAKTMFKRLAWGFEARRLNFGVLARHPRLGEMDREVSMQLARRPRLGVERLCGQDYTRRL